MLQVWRATRSRGVPVVAPPRGLLLSLRSWNVGRPCHRSLFAEQRIPDLHIPVLKAVSPVTTLILTFILIIIIIIIIVIIIIIIIIIILIIIIIIIIIIVIVIVIVVVGIFVVIIIIYAYMYVFMCVYNYGSMDKNAS